MDTVHVYFVKPEILKKKAEEMKKMLGCISSLLLTSGVFEACSGCSNDVICSNIKRMIEKKIKKTYFTVEKAKGR